MKSLDLTPFRARIDALDDRLLDLLDERSRIVAEVGALKNTAAPGECPLRSGREADQIRRIVKASTGKLFSPAASADVWRALINGSLNIESPLSFCAAATPETSALFWLAREYFGPYASAATEPTPKRVIGAVAAKKSAIGIVPVPANGDESPWWPDLVSDAPNWPKIFAILPFTRTSHDSSLVPQAFALAHLTPEPSESDISLIALRSTNDISQSRIQSAFQKSGHALVSLHAHNGGGTRWHLAHVAGYHAPGAPLYAALQKELDAEPHWLGAYATPLTLEK